MKYYSEEIMRDYRLQIEKELLQWPDVSRKKMFGCPSYQVRKNLFAFLVTEGIVLTKISDEDKEEIKQKYGVTPFQAGKRIVKKWVQISLKEDEDTKSILNYIKRSYNNALL